MPVADGGSPGVAGGASGIDGGTSDSGGARTEPSPRRLDIPPRLQWENDHGYCGETSIQAIGLYYGVWVSQKVVRDLAGGELLLGVNETRALEKLKLDYEVWSDAGSSQSQPFMVWLKKNLAAAVPCVIAVYLSDGTDADYDHIIPATGIAYTSLSSYDANDEITVSDNFGAEVARRAGSYAATRSTCKYSADLTGCIPRDTDYGVAIKGVLDADKVTLPVRIAVGSNAEPNVSLGQAAAQITATVTVSGLQAGRDYALLRYDGYQQVPTKGAASAFLSSGFSSRHDFTASGLQYTYADPKTFASDGATYYRAVPR